MAKKKFNILSRTSLRFKQNSRVTRYSYLCISSKMQDLYESLLMLTIFSYIRKHIHELQRHVTEILHVLFQYKIVRDILLRYRLIAVVPPHLNALSLGWFHDIIWDRAGGGSKHLHIETLRLSSLTVLLWNVWCDYTEIVYSSWCDSTISHQQQHTWEKLRLQPYYLIPTKRSKWQT